MSSKNSIKLTFLGTGTSQGVPVIACNCNVCLSEDNKDKRLRSSVLIETEGVTFAIDSGPDFRQQMLRESIQHLDAIVFTHEHKDHVAGLDDVRAFNFKSKVSMAIYCTEQVFQNLSREFHYVFDPKFLYPGIPKIEPHIIENQSFKVNGVEVLPIEVLHYKLPVFGYRIGDVTYITDANKIAPEEFEKMRGSKILVLNALRKTEHISHFSLEEALAIIKEIQPEKAYLTHISHLMGRHHDVSLELPDNVEIAYDGLQVEL